MGFGSTVATTAFVIVATPFLLITAIVLLPIAILTTLLAASALSLRAFIVYLELFTAIVHNYLSSKSPSPPKWRNKSVNAAIPRTRSVRSVSSSSGSRTPKFEPPIVHAATPLTRDFEGVGGWRLPVEDDESEGQWLTMNSRLELPSVSSVAPTQRQRHHHRHHSSGALLAPSSGSLKRPTIRSRPNSVIISGDVSPEPVLPGLGVGARVKSMVQLGEARRKQERRKSSSSMSSTGTALISPQQS